MTRDRGWRRVQRTRVLKRSRVIFRKIMGMNDEDAERHAVRCHDHVKMCSCPMCGNPRRHFGERTIQERRLDSDE